MFPAKIRRNITVDEVLWHYILEYDGIVAQNTETNDMLHWRAGAVLQITPALVAEIIKTGGKPAGFDTSKPKKFITTTLPYANATAHIGHTFEYVLADAIARFFRTKLGDTNVHLNVGLDEHGKKIYEAALAAGKEPAEYLEELQEQWKLFCVKFKIEYNSFYRTSHSQHHKKVSDFWNKCKSKGLIYKTHYTGNYCVGCESFKLDKDLTDGSCLDHPNLQIQQVAEENYFFALSKYKKRLLDWATTDIELKPEKKKAELISFIEDIQDISISRKRESVPWGVIVPGDSDQVIYVWFDALLNYILILGYGDKDKEKDFERYWKDSVQIFGPDNLKFQAAIFQALLYAADVDNTKTLLCHGTILDKNGRKMSKTLGNVVDPIDQLEKFGVDAVRYYALAGLNTYGNSGWDEKQLVNIYNSHLADVYGNLLSRVVHLISLLPDWNRYRSWDRNEFYDQFREVDKLWNEYEVSAALAKVNDILKQANKYITEHKPWEESCQNPYKILTTLYWCLQEATTYYAPVFPDKAKLAFESLRSKQKIVLFPKLKLEETV